MDRIFAEISNGTDRWFDYPQNLERAKRLIQQYGNLFRGKKPRIDVALWHPTMDLELRPSFPWSPQTYMAAEPLRQVIDYEVLDDRMIRDGALDKMGIKCLVLAGARWLDRGAWEKVLEWTRRGGFFVVGQAAPIQDQEGSVDLWQAQMFPNLHRPRLLAMIQREFSAREKRRWDRA